MADGSFEHRAAAVLLHSVPMSLWPETVRNRRTMLQIAAERAERLLADLVEKLDTLEPDPDLEPSLGAPEHPAHLRGVPPDYFVWAGGANDGSEMEETDQNLGGLGDRTTQLRWAEEGAWEGDGDPDAEPSLGAALDLQGRHDQEETWGVDAARQQTYRAGGKLFDMDDAEHDGREEQCEDEGAQCDDEGAIETDAEHDGAEPDEGDGLDMGFDIVQREFMEVGRTHV